MRQKLWPQLVAGFKRAIEMALKLRGPQSRVGGKKESEKRGKHKESLTKD